MHECTCVLPNIIDDDGQGANDGSYKQSQDRTVYMNVITSGATGVQHRLASHYNFPLPNPPGQGNNTLVVSAYFLHLLSSPHFFSALSSKGGTPEAYRNKT